ncbi:unnamed protein product [Parnassius apollo]|uniref:(apollo) hypothetical protein n=1 Tax=Parnassius apollo TaxID=110799 RepID=A0A8S3X5Q6_PARAO|nr:unnamed protein product [Parnassius apollo]
MYHNMQYGLMLNEGRLKCSKFLVSYTKKIEVHDILDLPKWIPRAKKQSSKRTVPKAKCLTRVQPSTSKLQSNHTPQQPKQNLQEQQSREKKEKRIQSITMSETPGRPMKFPYTFSAKVAQFPLKFYIQNQWIWRYWFISFGVCLPVFYKIHKMANSPENVSKWAEIRRKEAAEHHH